MSKIKPKECQNVEFKTSWNDKYLEWICGFANAQGAVMYFGVNDDHEVVGLKNTKKLLEDIPNKIVNYMGLVVDLDDNKPHEYRAPDYDDWNLNGDLIVYDKIIDGPMELSSMGIRVDSESIVSQLKKRKQDELLNSDFAKKIINNVLPLTYGGGIGQSRLCMLFLEKKHIGEVQASIWTNQEKERAEKEGFILL